MCGILNIQVTEMACALPNRPTHYALCVKTDLNATPAPIFEGTAEIDLAVLEETEQITFHAAPALEILKVVLQSKSVNSSQPQVIKSIERDEKFERCTVNVPEKLTAGSEAKLGIVYKGVLEGSMMGYYRSSYEFEGKKGFYGLTQFEPTAARRAFPCWDEPAISQFFFVFFLLIQKFSYMIWGLF
jgi:aminopeptidase 2